MAEKKKYLGIRCMKKTLLTVLENLGYVTKESDWRYDDFSYKKNRYNEWLSMSDWAGTLGVKFHHARGGYYLVHIVDEEGQEIAYYNLFEDLTIRYANGHKEIKALQEVWEMQEQLDYRTSIENEAIALTSQCRFEEAIELLKQI